MALIGNHRGTLRNPDKILKKSPDNKNRAREHTFLGTFGGPCGPHQIHWHVVTVTHLALQCCLPTAFRNLRSPMPLPHNTALSLLGYSRPGDAVQSKPKQAMIIRMSAETLDALESFPNHPQMEFELGANPVRLSC